MALIDASYFMGDVNIAQLSQPAVQENVQYFIQKYETDLLDRTLGLELKRDFLAGLEEEYPEQKWLDLLNGADFTGRWRGCSSEKRRLRHWVGFANEEIKLTPIANYVYYWYQRDQVTQTVGIGTGSTRGENIVKVSPTDKNVRAWNEMINWLIDLNDFLMANINEYAEYSDLIATEVTADAFEPDGVTVTDSRFVNIQVLNVRGIGPLIKNVDYIELPDGGFEIMYDGFEVETDTVISVFTQAVRRRGGYGTNFPKFYRLCCGCGPCHDPYWHYKNTLGL